MVKLLFCWTTATAIAAVTALGDTMLGPGRWDVLNIRLCDNPDKYEYQFYVQKKKITRDKDCYHGNMSLEHRIDEKYAIRIELCKIVDGGCKPFQNMSDDSFIGYIKKYAYRNTERLLILAGIDPPKFPVEPGFYHVENYVFDYCELLRTGVYGKFGTDVFLILDGNDMACMHFLLEFRAEEDDCDGNDEEVDEDYE